MSDENTDENPFSFKHFIKNKKDTVDLVSAPEENFKSGSDVVNVKNNDELPFPEVGESGVKKKTKGIHCILHV